MLAKQVSDMKNAHQAQVVPAHQELDKDLVLFLNKYGLPHLVELFAGEELDTQVMTHTK